MGESAKQTNIIIHKKPITDLHFNRDGDLLFSAGKDSKCCVMNQQGILIGTYSGHEGAINSIHSNTSSTKLITGGFDKMCIEWDICRGTRIRLFEFDGCLRSVYYADSSDTFFTCTDDSFSRQPEIKIHTECDALVILKPETVPTSLIVDFTDTCLIYSDLDGYMNLIDLRNYSNTTRRKLHTSSINRLKNSFCKSFFVTSSSDARSMIVDYSLDKKKEFASCEPINCAVISKENDRLLLAGGISARDVTTTRGPSKFSVSSFDIATTELIGTYNTHFGTINTIDIDYKSKVYASGGEDGIISIVKFGSEFHQGSINGGINNEE